MDDGERAFWTRMRSHTSARIGLGRAGDAVPTKQLLAFQLAWARAKDAVHDVADFDAIEADLAPLDCLRVRSQAGARATYLQRPDLGRRLAPESRALLQKHGGDRDWDVVLVAADGLSATALASNAVPVLNACCQQLKGWKIAPVILAEQARVAIGDDIAEALGARMVAIFIGERPGLSSPDSLGIYISWAPTIGTPDSLRNCISNIHDKGLSPIVAANKAIWLIREAMRLRLSGTALKEDAPYLGSLLDQPRAIEADEAPGAAAENG